ncbi:tubulin epsilon and delta complex protein 2-like [Microtus oregoni]|uniref:tubulin epsilon and delta complex protein 2-like n=1 Tax=Microtus oregoni TaxID=111838 RepID=UPI001BB17C6A|nr:tubulin epsilon and delta complex protein 2-like [Microtus oregoni]
MASAPDYTIYLVHGCVGALPESSSELQREEGLKDQQMVPSAVPHVPEVFTLKEKGTLRKTASQNSRLWAQLSTVQASDSTDDTRDTKISSLTNSRWLPAGSRCCGSGGSCPEPGEGPYTAEIAGAGRAADHCWLHGMQAHQQLPGLLLYSSIKELQTLATLGLHVAMLAQQIHLEKVLMAELLPLINTQEPGGPPWLEVSTSSQPLEMIM